MSLFLYFFFCIFSLLCIPFFDTLLKSLKAFVNGRRPLRLFQGYFDLIKLSKKETHESQFTSFFSHICPTVLFINSLIFFAFVPIIIGKFDIHIFYLFSILTLGNFSLILYAMDNSTYFSGLGVEREIFVLSIVESVLVLMIVLLAMIWWHTNVLLLHDIFYKNTFSPFEIIFYMVSVVVFFYIILAENNRFPFDNPSTHLELTMIHEAMLLETEWKQLLILELATKIKMFWFIGLFIWIFLPFTLWITNIFILFLLWCVKVVFIVSFIAFWEGIITKIRIFKYQEIFVTLLVTQILLVVFYILK